LISTFRNGPVFTSSPNPPGYGPDEILDRQQLRPVGTHLPMRGYQPFDSGDLPASSVDLATIYVGLHHVPLALRVPYVESVRAALRPGATLILRDHDVSSPALRHLVALAHDVFIVGTDQAWSANEHELRNFYPLDFIVSFLEQHGFAARPGRLLQDGDPTRNTLLAFTKV
jgi:SAM-dependent methyltransferase